MPINRRAFLHSVGLGAAAAALVGCGGTRVTSPAPRQPSVPAGPAEAPIDFAVLARKLSGRLVTPDQPGYDQARRSFNPLFDNRTPSAVAQCRRIEDVQACVSAAAGWQSSQGPTAPWTASSIAARAAPSRVTPTAPALSSICSGQLAPMMAEATLG